MGEVLGEHRLLGQLFTQGRLVVFDSFPLRLLNEKCVDFFFQLVGCLGLRLVLYPCELPLQNFDLGGVLGDVVLNLGNRKFVVF